MQGVREQGINCALDPLRQLASGAGRASGCARRRGCHCRRCATIVSVFINQKGIPMKVTEKKLDDGLTSSPPPPATAEVAQAFNVAIIRSARAWA